MLKHLSTVLQIVFFAKVGRLASKKVIVQLLKQKCLPVFFLVV